MTTCIRFIYCQGSEVGLSHSSFQLWCFCLAVLGAVFSKTCHDCAFILQLHFAWFYPSLLCRKYSVVHIETIIYSNSCKAQEDKWSKFSIQLIWLNFLILISNYMIDWYISAQYKISPAYLHGVIGKFSYNSDWCKDGTCILHVKSCGI